jgi:hypothetical protein
VPETVTSTEADAVGTEDAADAVVVPPSRAPAAIVAMTAGATRKHNRSRKGTASVGPQ